MDGLEEGLSDDAEEDDDDDSEEGALNGWMAATDGAGGSVSDATGSQ